jgi:hypothetical protein
MIRRDVLRKMFRIIIIIVIGTIGCTAAIVAKGLKNFFYREWDKPRQQYREDFK